MGHRWNGPIWHCSKYRKQRSRSWWSTSTISLTAHIDSVSLGPACARRSTQSGIGPAETLSHTHRERESTSLQGRRKYTREHGSPVIIPPTIHPSLASQLTANLRFHSLIYVLLTYAYLYELFTQKKIYELHIHVAQQTNSARWDRIDFASDAFLNELHSSCHHRVATANSCSQSQVTTINVQHWRRVILDLMPRFEPDAMPCASSLAPWVSGSTPSIP